jgi:hypothetical protein
LSSETYLLDPADLAPLDGGSTDERHRIRCSQGVVVLIGDSRAGVPDRLLRGRDRVNAAIQNGVEYIPVRVAFASSLPPGLSFLAAFKQVRKKYKRQSARSYHMSARQIRAMKIERSVRNAENAYDFSSAKWRPAEGQRLPKYQRLIESMKQRGYDDSEPVSVMLCRSFGVLDSLNQGHHRISAALDAGVDRIAVQFVATSKPPVLFSLFLYVPAFIKRALLNRQHFRT